MHPFGHRLLPATAPKGTNTKPETGSTAIETTGLVRPVGNTTGLTNISGCRQDPKRRKARGPPVEQPTKFELVSNGKPTDQRRQGDRVRPRTSASEKIDRLLRVEAV